MERVKVTEAVSRQKLAWETYLRYEEELLREHRGKYAWIVGDEIRAVCATQAELCEEFLKDDASEGGFVVKVGEREAPAFDVPSPLIS